MTHSISRQEGLGVRLRWDLVRLESSEVADA
jgi:hypothetical protein